MKTKLIDRVLLALVLLVVIALSLFIIAVAMRLVTADSICSAIYALTGDITASIALGSGGIVLLIAAIRLLFFGKGGRERKQPKTTSVLVKATEIGSTFISLAALDHMVQKHCRANNRIRECFSAVELSGSDGVRVALTLTLMPDSNIPELSAQLQNTLKEYVEQCSGINVREIYITVAAPPSLPKTRVD